MCEFRTTQQTQLIVEREADCDNEAEVQEEIDVTVWGRLLPIGSAFQPVGKFSPKVQQKKFDFI